MYAAWGVDEVHPGEPEAESPLRQSEKTTRAAGSDGDDEKVPDLAEARHDERCEHWKKKSGSKAADAYHHHHRHHHP